jgi:hypothetical protein
MQKLNCWEYKKCGRAYSGEAGGVSCPAFSERRLQHAHDGHRAGRACWVVAGTQCGGQVQGAFANKFTNCEQCDFYKQVKREEGANFRLSILLLKQLQTPDNKENNTQP